MEQLFSDFDVTVSSEVLRCKNPKIHFNLKFLVKIIECLYMFSMIYAFFIGEY